MIRDEILDYNHIFDVNRLIEEKERMKDEIMKSNINWICRIDLYRRIREINERISQLKNSP